MDSIEIRKSTPERLYWTCKALNIDPQACESQKVAMIPCRTISENLQKYTKQGSLASNQAFAACLFPFERLLKVANATFPVTCGAKLAFLGVLTNEDNTPMVHIVASHHDNDIEGSLTDGMIGTAIQVGINSVEEDLLFYSNRYCSSKSGPDCTYREDQNMEDWSKAISLLVKDKIDPLDFVALPIRIGQYRSSSTAMIVFCGGLSFPANPEWALNAGNLNGCLLSEYVDWRSKIHENVFESKGPRKIHICAQKMENRELTRILLPIRSWLASTCKTDEEWISRVGPLFDLSSANCSSDDDLRIEVSLTPKQERIWSRSFWDISYLWGRPVPLHKLPECDVFITAINFNCRGIFNYGNEKDLARLRRMMTEKPQTRCAVVWCGSQIITKGIMQKSTREIVLEAWPDLKDVLLVENNRELNDDQKRALSILTMGTDKEYKDLLRSQDE